MEMEARREAFKKVLQEIKKKVLTFSFFVEKVLTKYLLFDIIAENKQGDDNCA